MPSLTIEIKKVRGGAVAGATVTIRNNNGEKPEFRQTDPTGKCTFNNLQEGSYSIVAKVPPGLIPPRNGNLPVPPEFKTFRLIDNHSGCYYAVKRLKWLIKHEEFEKAERLVQRVKATYDNYGDLPVLDRIVDLEKELPRATNHSDRLA